MKHFALPFRISGRTAVYVEDGSSEEITQNVAVILGTREGERLTLPDFGVPDPTFRFDVDEAEMEAEVARWEPRADLTFTGSLPDLTVAVGVR